jgi:DNA-binding beta-propeller fold protein YncE
MRSVRWLPRFACATIRLALVALCLTCLTGMAQPATARAPLDAAHCGMTAAPSAATEPPTDAPLSPPITSGTMVLQTMVDIPLPGDVARFDYQSLDPTTGWLYIAHMGADQVVVFDTTNQTVVGTVDDLPTVTGVLAVPALNRVYAAVAGDHQVAVIDSRILTVVARLGEIGFPDGLDYAPQANQIFVSDESGGGELVIDAATNTIVTTIELGGEAGNTHYDPGSGCVLVALQSQTQIVVIDPMTDQIVGRSTLDHRCQGPHGFVIDVLARQAFVSCEDNATLLVVELETMEIRATFPVGDGPDVLAFDPGWRRLYVASESGTVSVFDHCEATLRHAGDLSVPHAHSIAVDAATHLVYLPLEDIDGQPVLRVMVPTSPRCGSA